MRNKILTLLMMLTICMAGTGFAADIVEYDAGPDGGGPVDIDPALQGWTGTDVAGSTVALQPDGTTGYNGWQIDDQGGTNPRYEVTLTGADFQAMYDRGWVYEVRFRPIAAGGFCGWGINPTTATDPGWGLGTTRERVGFGVNVTATNAVSISPIGGTTVVLADDSANEYHIFRAVGQRQSSVVDLYVNGVWNQQFDIKSGTSNSGSDNRTMFMSGSSSGTGRTVNWNFVSLREAVPLVVTETDGGTFVAEGLGTDTYDIELLPDPNYPTSPVTVTVTPGDSLYGVTVDTPTVIFPAWTGDPNDYTATVTVTAINDTLIELPIHSDVISHSASGADSQWNVGAFAGLTVDIADNDGTPGVTMNKSTVVVSEDGATDTYTIVLDTPPTSTVTIGFSPDVQLEDPNDLIFDDTNWATPQTVTVAAVDDLIAEDSPHIGVLSHTITTSDVDYGAMTLPDMIADILDNDTVGPTSVAAFAWFKADAGTINGDALAADGEDVTRWIDQTGNGRDLYRLSSGQGRPSYVADGGYTGQPTLNFDIDEHIWASRSEFHAPLDGADPFPHTVFIVGTMDTQGHMHYIESTSSNGNFDVGQTAAGLYEMDTDQTMVTDDPVPLGARVVLTAVFNGAASDSELYQNGTLLHSQALPSGDAGLSGLMVGSFGTNFDGEIAEIVWYKGSLTSPEQAAVETYLMDKYLGKIAVYETGTTEVTEGGAPDTYDIEVFGTPTAQVDILVTPTGPNAGDIDLGSGPGVAITLNFPTAGIQTVTVTAVDNAASDGPRDVTITHVPSSADASYVVAVDDVVVTVNDDEEYCGQAGTVYHLADLNQDCYVTLADFAILAGQWLDCTNPGDANCQQLP